MAGSKDATGWKRGERGYANDSEAAKFLKADFDREKQQGPISDDGNEGGFDPKPTGFKGYKGIDKR